MITARSEIQFLDHTGSGVWLRNRMEHHCARVVQKRERPRGHFVQHDERTRKIRRPIRRFSPVAVTCRRCADRRARLGDTHLRHGGGFHDRAPLHHELGQPEIQNSHGAMLADKDIRRFDIANHLFKPEGTANPLAPGTPPSGAASPGACDPAAWTRGSSRSCR